MKINGLQVETVKGEYARYGLSADRVTMQVHPIRTGGGMADPLNFMPSFQLTAEQAYAFSDETRKAAVVLLVDDVRNVEPAGEVAAQDNPAPTPWKPAVGDLVQIVKENNWGRFEVGSIVKIEEVACHPKARDKSGELRCLRYGSYLPVREVDRPAKVGEWIRLKIDVYEHAKAGDLLKVDIFSGVALVKGKNHPRQTFQSKPEPEFEWAYPDYCYRVLEPYSPEAAHA